MIAYEKAYLRVAEFFFDERNRARRRTSYAISFVPIRSRAANRAISTHCAWISAATPTPFSPRFTKRRATRSAVPAKRTFSCEYHSHPDAVMAEEFFAFYDRFADIKNVRASIARASRPFDGTTCSIFPA
jgi:hypothetical protein